MLFELQPVNVIESINEEIRATLLAERELHYLAINHLATKSSCRHEANLPNHNQDFMHHLSSSHLHINQCYTCAKFVIKKLMLFIILQ